MLLHQKRDLFLQEAVVGRQTIVTGVAHVDEEEPQY